MENFSIDGVIKKLVDESLERGFGSIDNDVIEYVIKSLTEIISKEIPVKHIYPLDEGGVAIEVLLSNQDFYTFSFYNGGHATLTQWNMIDNSMNGWDMDYEQLYQHTKTLRDENIKRD